MSIELVAEPRTELGKEKCKKLRVANKLPGNIYGGPLDEPRSIQLDLHATEKIITDNGRKAEYVVVLEDERYPVRIEEIRFEPVYQHFQHVDFVVLGNE